MKTCKEEGCTDTVLAKEWCSKHYQRWLKYGDPLFIKIREPNLSDEELRIWLRSPPQSKRDPYTGCREWCGSLNSYGYGHLRYKGKMVLAHRLIWFFTYDYWPKDMLLHSCDNRKCINIKHLREGSTQDNMADMVKKGRQPKGEKNGNAKITEKQVIKIRKKYRTGRHTQKDLAEMFGVTRVSISYIINRKTWKHLD